MEGISSNQSPSNLLQTSSSDSNGASNSLRDMHGSEYFQNIMSKSKFSITDNKGIEGLRQARKIIVDCDPGGDDC
jgi:hypothetical protein